MFFERFFALENLRALVTWDLLLIPYVGMVAAPKAPSMLLPSLELESREHPRIKLILYQELGNYPARQRKGLEVHRHTRHSGNDHYRPHKHEHRFGISCPQWATAQHLDRIADSSRLRACRAGSCTHQGQPAYHRLYRRISRSRRNVDSVHPGRAATSLNTGAGFRQLHNLYGNEILPQRLSPIFRAKPIFL